MRPLVIYLNELSCACNSLSRAEMTRHLDAALRAISAVTSLRSDTIIRMHCRLGDLTFGVERLPLHAILTETNGRFAQFKRLLDKSPCGPVSSLTREIRFEGQIPIGLTWADLDESFVFSLGHCSPWSEQAIPCERHRVDDALNLTIADVAVCNIASIIHTTHWQQRIEEYGYDLARSSFLHQGDGFVVRFHTLDHDPAHVHIYPRAGDTRDLIARVRVDNGDYLDGWPSSAMREEIADFITAHRQELLQRWLGLRGG